MILTIKGERWFVTFSFSKHTWVLWRMSDDLYDAFFNRKKA